MSFFPGEKSIKSILFRHAWIFGIVVFLDQLTKFISVQLCQLHKLYPVTSFFSIRLIYNKGAMMGIIKSTGPWLIVAGFLLLVFFLYFVLYLIQSSKYKTVGEMIAESSTNKKMSKKKQQDITEGIELFLISQKYVKDPKNQRIVFAALFLIIGGAFSNMIDKIFFGRVVDFFKLHLFNWPIFNTADIAISLSLCIAAFYGIRWIIVVINGFISNRKKRKSNQ